MTTPSGFMKDNRNFLKSGFSLKNNNNFSIELKLIMKIGNI